jgi:predicted transcriptional regulator
MRAGDNLNRLRVGEAIGLLPGIHIRGLAKLLGLQLSTTSYHVDRLEKDGKIICSRDGGYLRAYPGEMTGVHERRTYALLQHKAAREIMKLLVKESELGLGMSNGELSSSLNLSESTVSKYVRSMRGIGLVSKVPAKEGRWVLEIGPEDRERLAGIVIRLERDFFSSISDSYAELWNF